MLKTLRSLTWSRIVALATLGVVTIAVGMLMIPPPREADAGYFGTNDIVLLPSAARTADANSADMKATFYKGVRLFVDIDSVTGTGTVAVKVSMKDPISGAYVDMPGATTGTKTAGTYELVVYPGIAETSNVSISDVLPKTWRVTAAVVTGGTFSVAASTLE